VLDFSKRIWSHQDMPVRDCIDDIDVICHRLLLGHQLGINKKVLTRWSKDNLVSPSPKGNKMFARRLRRCLNLPEGFTGKIVFSFHDSKLSGPPWIEDEDGGRYVALR